MPRTANAAACDSSWVRFPDTEYEALRCKEFDPNTGVATYDFRFAVNKKLHDKRLFSLETTYGHFHSGMSGCWNMKVIGKY